MSRRHAGLFYPGAGPVVRLAERSNLTQLTYETTGGIGITRATEELPYADSPLNSVLDGIDTHRGAIFASGYEYPGRYSRWDIGFISPPLEIVARGRDFTIRALNERGKQLLQICRLGLEGHEHPASLEVKGDELHGTVKPIPEFFPEEERSKQPTIFSVLRSLIRQMHSEQDSHLGFYGAFGYDLVFQFEPIKFRHERGEEDNDLHLFFPDELIVVDHRMKQARRYQYDFRLGQFSTAGLPRNGEEFPIQRGTPSEVQSDHAPGEYAAKVKQIIEGARRGDFLEVVLSQVLSAGYPGTPRELFESIRERNPSPYEFLINLGEEQLVGASPEMLVRVEGDRVEICPISGTIRRGATPIDDAAQVLALLNSKKDRIELTMCTDVGRSDTSRVCRPGTVKVLGRRMIEMYSRLIHTVDHVEGILLEGYDGLDALLSNMWACTLTGSPKPAAMQMIEDLENSPRGWYGACVGMLLFDGNVNTGITIRTVHLKEGIASVRAGATLLHYSDPDSEERETRIKAEAFVNAILGVRPVSASEYDVIPMTGKGKTVLFVDCRDSFVHTLANYVRQTGARVVTVRAGFPERIFNEVNPDLVFISPGPGRPKDFGVPELVLECVKRELPVFGICLGLQGIVEAFGGELGVLSTPVHGEGSVIKCKPEGIFAGFPIEFTAGRYHSLFAISDKLPDCFKALASTGDGVIVAIQHKKLPIAAVQFHPESILTLKDNLGLRLIAQVVGQLAK